VSVIAGTGRDPTRRPDESTQISRAHFTRPAERRSRRGLSGGRALDSDVPSPDGSVSGLVNVRRSPSAAASPTVNSSWLQVSRSTCRCSLGTVTARPTCLTRRSRSSEGGCDRHTSEFRVERHTGVTFKRRSSGAVDGALKACDLLCLRANPRSDSCHEITHSNSGILPLRVRRTALATKRYEFSYHLQSDSYNECDVWSQKFLNSMSEQLD